MRIFKSSLINVCSLILFASFFLSCLGMDSDDDPEAAVRIKNDFNNPAMERKPPWVICESSYRGVEFGKVVIGDSSAQKKVEPGLEYVLMVVAWNDETCAVENCLPVASRNEEEVVNGQVRTISINAPNHQGPCPPEGVQPIPENLYEQIVKLWPDYGFKSYTEREQNPQCLD